MTWTEWMRLRLVSGVVAIVMGLGTGAPSVFAFADAEQLRPRATRKEGSVRKDLESDQAWIYSVAPGLAGYPLVPGRIDADVRRDLVGEAKEAIAKAFHPKEQRAFTIGKVGRADAHVGGFGQWSPETLQAVERLVNQLSRQEPETVTARGGQAVLTFRGAPTLTVEDPVVAEMARFINAWALLRRERENGEKVSDREQAAAFTDLINTVWLLQQSIDSIEDHGLKQYLLTQVRFVPTLEDTHDEGVVRDLKEEARLIGEQTGVEPPLHYEYGRGAPWLVRPGETSIGSAGHVALAGYAGRHRGSPSIYTSVARGRGYARLIRQAEQANQAEQAAALRLAFREWLAHEARDLQADHHVDEPEDVAERINQGERLIVQHYQEERSRALERVYEEDRNRFTETFVAVDFSRGFGQLAQIPETVVEAVEGALTSAVEQGQLNDVLVRRFGELLIIDATHGGPLYALGVQDVVAAALRKGFEKAAELGYYQPGEVDLRSASREDMARALDWNTDSVRYTKGPNNKRRSQPTLRQFIFGGDVRAFNTILFNVYASPALTTMQPIEGSPGLFFANQQVEGLQHDTWTRIVRGEQPDPSGKKEIVMHLPHAIFEQVNLNKGPDPDQGVGSAYATKAVFAGKGSRFPTDEPLVTVLNLGRVQVAVYQSQAGAEAIGGILGPATKDQTVDGTIGGEASRLDLRPVTWGQAATLTSEALKGQRVAPTTFIGSQMNRGRFGEILDPIRESPEFGVRTLVKKVKGEIDFAKVYQAHWPVQPGTNAMQATERSFGAWKALKQEGAQKGELSGAGLQQPELIPNRRTEFARWAEASEARDGVTMSIFKADIGSSLGHTIPPTLLMTLARAYLDYAKSKGWIRDYLMQEGLPMFRVGDDIEIVISHDKGIDEREIHGVAWRAFYFAGYVALAAGRDEYYGLMQDLPTGLDFFLESKPDSELMEQFALPLLRELSMQDPHAIRPQEVALAVEDFQRKYADVQAGRYQPPKAVARSIFEATGNVRGSGIGFAELPLSKLARGKSYTALMFDKASPGAFSLPFYEAALAALEHGDYDNLMFEIDVVKPSPEHGVEQETMLVDVATHPELIVQALASVNEFQIKALWTRRNGAIGLVAVNSTERLYQSEKAGGAYLGKDDPASLMERAFAKHVINWMADHGYIVQGDERGSHWKFVLPVPAAQSSPGTYSIPVSVAVSFTVGQNGELRDIVDEFADPRFELALARAVAGNELQVERHGNDPRRGAIADIEEAYPGRVNHRAIVKAARPALTVGESRAEQLQAKAAQQFPAIQHRLSVDALSDATNLEHGKTALIHPEVFSQRDLAVAVERYLRQVAQALGVGSLEEAAKKSAVQLEVPVAPIVSGSRDGVPHARLILWSLPESAEEKTTVVSLAQQWASTVPQTYPGVTAAVYQDDQEVAIELTGERAEEAAEGLLHTSLFEYVSDAAKSRFARLVETVNAKEEGATQLQADWFTVVLSAPTTPEIAIGPSDWVQREVPEARVKVAFDPPKAGNLRSASAAFYAGVEAAATGGVLTEKIKAKLDVLDDAGILKPEELAVVPETQQEIEARQAYETSVREAIERL